MTSNSEYVLYLSNLLALWLGKMNQEVNTIIQGIRYAASQGVMDIASQG
jgi:hypothetical protein